MAKQNIMNIIALKKLLNEIGNEVSDDYQVWLSSDEEGNEFMPMLENTEFCLLCKALHNMHYAHS
jgi:hypothetical protein